MNRITMYNKSRIEYIDIAKGIGILLMVIGHMVSIFPIRQFIFQFHMPMFLIFSGFLFNDKKWGGGRKRSRYSYKQDSDSFLFLMFVFSL